MTMRTNLLECTSWLMKVRFSKLGRSPVWSEISSSMLWSSTRSFFPLTNQNLTIKNLKKIELLFRSYSGHSSCNSSQKMKIQDFKPSDQRFNVTVEHADPIITASSAEGANQRSATASTATSSQPLLIPHPPGLQIPQGVQSKPQVPQQPQQAPQAQPQQSVQVRRRNRTKSRPQDSSEISAVLQEIKENHLSVGRDQVNADHQEAQSEEELLQGLILQEWYQGDLFRDIQKSRSRKLSQKRTHFPNHNE